MLETLDRQLEAIINKVLANKEKEIAEKYEAIYKDKVEQELHKIKMQYLNSIPQYASRGNVNTPKQY